METEKEGWGQIVCHVDFSLYAIDIWEPLEVFKEAGMVVQ